MRSNPSLPEAFPTTGSYWRAKFGARVQRVVLDPGFSCPNRDGTVGRGGCTFCDPASFSPACGDPRPIAQQLAERLGKLRARGHRRFAAYFQPHTNTHASRAALDQAWKPTLTHEDVVALCVATRPDCVPEPVLDLLGSYGASREVWLELGLQSAHDATLRRVNRGHTAEQFADAARRAGRRGLLVCAHVILGLPGESLEHERVTAEFLANLGVAGVKLRQLAVVRGTPLEAEWRNGGLAVLEEAQYIERAAAFLSRLPPSTVLHRVVGETRGERLLAPRFRKGSVAAAILGRVR